MIFTKGPHRSMLKVALMRSLVGTKDQSILAGRQEWLGGVRGGRNWDTGVKRKRRLVSFLKFL